MDWSWRYLIDYSYDGGLVLFHAGIEWSPRMDVAESGCSYVVTVEIPGVNCHDIRVEIDDQK